MACNGFVDIFACKRRQIKAKGHGCKSLCSFDEGVSPENLNLEFEIPDKRS